MKKNKNLVSKSKLKAKMLEYFREVEKNKEPLIVTDFGEPVLKVIPYVEKLSVEDLFQDVQGKLEVYEDLTIPTQDEWSEI